MALKKPKTETKICYTCHQEKPATTDYFQNEQKLEEN